MAPPLSETEICEAEAELGIAFPDQYRAYLLRRSAGGAVNRLRRSVAGWGWQGDSDTNYDLLTTAFPHPDSYRAEEEELDARTPSADDYPDESAYRAAWQQWDAEYEVFQERKTSGAVFIQDNGCGFATLLVVTGPLRGSLWFDGRASCDRILPLQLDGLAGFVRGMAHSAFHGPGRLVKAAPPARSAGADRAPMARRGRWTGHRRVP